MRAFDRSTVLFVGWFGPRGLASLVFALLALEDVGSAADEAVAVIAMTVLFSVLLTGSAQRGWPPGTGGRPRPQARNRVGLFPTCPSAGCPARAPVIRRPAATATGWDPRDSGAAEQLVGAVAGFTGALGFAPTTRLTGPVGGLPGDLVTDLFAVVGEALTNVARHAHAASAGVDIAVSADAVTACVVDDGIGLAAAPRDGGLADLRRRAAWHGGTLTVRPGTVGGTRLTWTVPHHMTSPASG